MADNVESCQGKRLMQDAIYNLRDLGTACPSQWTAETADDLRVYIRYRFGWLSVSVDGEVVSEEKVGDSLDGVMDTDKMLAETGLTLIHD